MKKEPSLVIYWADTRALLTFAERRELEQEGVLVAVTPLEILIEHSSGRKAVVRGITDFHAPKIVTLKN